MNQATDSGAVSLLACDDGFDPIEGRLRANIRSTIETVFNEELDSFLGRLRYGREAGAVLARVGRFIGESPETDTLDLGKRVNAVGRPPSRALASVSTRAAETLRRLGLYGVVNMA